MRRRLMLTSVALCALAALSLSGSALAAQDMQEGASVFDAVLRGSNEVPPTTSTAVGVSSLLLSSDGTTLYYSLEITGASSTVNAAHIHLGVAGQNGDVVANLCGAGGTPACTPEGVTARGSITDANLVGPLANQTLGDLLTALRSGGAYVNAHTATSPGGEMRGQVEALGVEMMMGGEHQSQDDSSQN